MDADMQTPLDSATPSPLPSSKNIKKAIPTLDFETVGSDMVGREQRLGFQERINLILDRECTPILYVYFAGTAVLGVITVGIIVIIGLQCNWNFVAVE